MLVSIFIPTYNAACCIEQTLKSVLCQSFKDIEVWIVDDCSTDETPQILDRWASQDSRVKVIHKETNEGFVPYSWNWVLTRLNGDFSFYLSHDDLLEENCISELVEMQMKTGADCVIPEVRMWNVSQDVREVQAGAWTSHGNTCLKHGAPVVTGKTAFANMLNYDIPGFALWRTSLIQNVGMPEEAWNSDEGMQRVWALNCQKVAFCMSAIFYYRITPASITRGLKPYHLSGLLTQKRLAKLVLSEGVWWQFPKQSARFLWMYLKSYLYLHRKLKNR